MTTQSSQNLVYVLNQNGKPLMPCRPTKARHLLQAAKAKVARRFPFTIQLLWDCEDNTQPITVGIDKGAKFTGVAAVRMTDQKVLLQATLHHRTDISDKMTTRRQNRRARRSRKWYRKPRFLNRASARRSGRLAPSIKANVEEVWRVVSQLPLPISKIIIEDVLIDIAKINDPTLRGKGYQLSNRLDENLRLACLMRDKFTCRICGGNKQKHSRLQAHHIVPKSKGGKDTIDNLVTLCEKCHALLHKGKITLPKSVGCGVSGWKDVIAQHTMQGKQWLYHKLSQLVTASLETVFGYETAEARHQLDLPKDHVTDAYVIAVMAQLGNEDLFNNYNLHNKWDIRFRPRQTRRQYFDLPRKGKGRVRYQVNAEVGGLRKGDIVKVKGYVKQIKAICSNGRVAFRRVKGEISDALPKACKLLCRSQTMVWVTLMV